MSDVLVRVIAAVLLLSPALSVAGDFHAAEFPATVSSRSVVKDFSLPDRWAHAFGLPESRLTGTNACLIEAAVEFPGPAFRKANGQQRFVASEAACSRMARGQRITVQTLGLAGDLQVVAVRIGGKWFSLPLMRRSAASVHSVVAACLEPPDAGVACEPLLGDRPL